MADQPPDDGPGNRRRTLLDNRSTSQENGCAKQRAVAPWPTCQNADVECDGKTRSPTGPQTPGTGDPRPAVRHGLTVGQNFSALSCSLLRHTEWPHLHCRADAVVTPAATVPYHLDTPLSFVSPHPSVWYAGHGHGEVNKQSTDSKPGATGDNYPAHNRPNVGRSLISILRSRQFNSFIIT